MISSRIFQPENSYNLTPLQQAVVGANLAGVVASTDDLRMLEQLRSGDEAAFVLLIDRYASAMLRLAMIYVKARAVAEEVVQETWLAVLNGLTRFEGRSSLKTWVFRILTHCAITRAQREGRSIPFSSLAGHGASFDEPAADSDCLLPAGHWVSYPSNWQEMPEERLLSQETRAHLEKAIEVLPPSQRQIIILRDIEGWTSEETCSFLGISEVNQRVLLHRARAKVRGVLEKYFGEEHVEYGKKCLDVEQTTIVAHEL
jgi:RNA polymerase sigma-70 factor (ECF subfamily)